MSLGMAAGRFTKGYLGQERVEEQADVAEAQAQSQGEERRLKMDQIKETMRKENFKEALQHMMVGDFSAAEEAYGKSGKRKMRPGSAKGEKDDEGNTVFTWVDDESGQPVATDMRFALLATGTNPNLLETPKQKHARAMELAQVKSSGAGTAPADVKLYNHIISNLKNPKTGKKYTPEEAWREARRSRESRLKIASQMASAFMRANPGVTAEETQEHVDQMMGGLEQKYGTAGGAMAGPGGGAMPAPAGGAADFMPTPDQLADFQDKQKLVEQREDDAIDPYDFD